MTTISSIVKETIQSRPMMMEALTQGILQVNRVAAKLKPTVEARLGEKVKTPAMVMAIRRLAQETRKKDVQKVAAYMNAEITMKTGLGDMTFHRTPTLLAKLKKVYELVEYEKGETLNIISGNYEVTIVISEKHVEQLLELLKEEKLKSKEANLISIIMTFPKSFLHTPGILAKATRKLLWEGINIYENISTVSELIFVVHKNDAVRAYNALQMLIDEKER